MVKFGGSLIPNHFVGLQAEGNLPSGGLGLGYNLGLGKAAVLAQQIGDSGDSITIGHGWRAYLPDRQACMVFKSVVRFITTNLTRCLGELSMSG